MGVIVSIHLMPKKWAAAAAAENVHLGEVCSFAETSQPELPDRPSQSVHAPFNTNDVPIIPNQIPARLSIYRILFFLFDRILHSSRLIII
jgi:hypothetical protein